MTEPGTAPARLLLLRARARRVLGWEQAWVPLRTPLLLAALYGLACLARIPQTLPDWLHALFEIAFFVAILWLAVSGLRALPKITDSAADRRIERASDLAYQPLLTLADRPAFAGNAEQATIWARHVERVTASLGTLRVGLPRLPLTSLDRIGLAATSLALAAALVLSGTHAPSRLHAGFIPGVDDDSVPLPTLQAWIDRPAYAPGAPIFLSATGQSVITVPQGAILNATITEAGGKPALSGLSRMDETRMDSRSWNAHGTLEQSGTIDISVRGRALGRWKVIVTPDLPPDVSWNGTPGPQKDDWRTGLPWHVHQAYGVASLEAEMTLPGLSRGRVLHVPIPLNGQPKDAKGVATPDLSSDPFAGMEVEGRLHATSASGRETRSAPVRFIIGARKFTDPLARALVAVRHRLMLGQERTSRALEELSLLAGTTDERAVLAPLALTIASLDKDAPEDAAEKVPGELWALALYLDDLTRDGPEIADAAAEVRAAQDSVQQQLDHMHALGDKGHTLPEQEELQRRTQALTDALKRRMQLLFQRAEQSGVIMPESGANSADPFSEQMRRLQSDANQGQSDEALKRLQQMEDMAERMRQATPEDLKALAEQMKAQEEAHAQRAALHDLVHRETTLLDHTQARLSAARKAAAPPDDQSQRDVSTMSTADLLRQLGMQPPPGLTSSATPEPPPPIDAATVAAQADARRADHALQRALQRLDDILGRRVKDLTGKPATAFEKANTDMQSARKALAERNDADAQTAEQKVLADLSNAGKQMRQNQKSGGGKGQSGGALSFIPSGSGHSAGTSHHGAKGQQDDDGDQPQAGDEDGDDDVQKDQDPLGRKLGEGQNGKDSDAHIPDKSARDRARDIERELRRRASDRTRPQSELNYLERLLKSF